jgi:hypothetical protein
MHGWDQLGFTGIERQCWLRALSPLSKLPDDHKALQEAERMIRGTVVEVLTAKQSSW